MKQKIGEIILSSIHTSNVMHQIHITLQQSRLPVVRLKYLYFFALTGEYAFRPLHANGNSSCCGVRLIKSNLHFRRFGSFCLLLSYVMTDPALLERNNYKCYYDTSYPVYKWWYCLCWVARSQHVGCSEPALARWQKVMITCASAQVFKHRTQTSAPGVDYCVLQCFLLFLTQQLTSAATPTKGLLHQW